MTKNSDEQEVMELIFEAVELRNIESIKQFISLTDKEMVARVVNGTVESI